MIGTEIGNYRIVEKIGAGGMGVVYKAIDTHLDRVVAVKALSPEFSGDPTLLERFRGEAHAQAQLNHPNLATLYAFLVQDDVAYMVMEFVDGETFHAMVARRGPIPAEEAVPLFRQALAGIGYAHRLGIVHRDIKPSNIMLNREGVVKVMDFGLAKVAGGHGVTRTESTTASTQPSRRHFPNARKTVGPCPRKSSVATPSAALSRTMALESNVSFFGSSLRSAARPASVRRYAGAREARLRLPCVKGGIICARHRPMGSW